MYMCVCVCVYIHTHLFDGLVVMIFPVVDMTVFTLLIKLCQSKIPKTFTIKYPLVKVWFLDLFNM